MRSQEQLWIQSPLSSSAAVTSSKQGLWRTIAVKRLLSSRMPLQASGRGSPAHYIVFLSSHLQGEAQSGHVHFEALTQEFQALVNVNSGGHRNGKTLFVAQEQMQRHVRNCRFAETRMQPHLHVNSENPGLGYGALQAQQQAKSARIPSYWTYYPCVNSQSRELISQQHQNAHEQSQDYRLSKCQEHVHMKVQAHGYGDIVTRRQKVGQGPGSLAQCQPQAATLARPLPKRLLPIPIARRSLSTTSRPPPYRKHIAIADSVQLTDLEFKIFNTLKAVLVHYRLKTQLRVAGGWVRDKLLGRKCGDIDITLDDMLGRTFCKKLSSYCREVGMQTSGFGIIRSNPTQAKHLEVARMKILGVAIDFVNLRPDDYAESSSESFYNDFGTIVEDAFRRDLTINSLYYNIDTRKVEDPTGKGLSDLRAGIIATPLPAKATFTDDPLRALRALRFVSVLDYELHPDAKDAIDTDIKLALAAKISRERIGVEVDKIFRCSQPLKAMELLVEIHLFPIVFNPPTDLGITVPEGIGRTCLHALGATVDVVNYFGSTKLLEDHRKSLYLAAFLSPLRAHFYEHKGKSVSISTVIIKESLKLRSIDAAMVVTLHRTAGNYPLIRKLILKTHTVDQGLGDCLISDLDLQMSYSNMKQQIGKLLGEARGLWRSALLLGAVLEDDFMIDSTYEKRKEELKRRSNLCIFVEEAIVKLGLEDITSPFPFVERSVRRSWLN